MFKSGCADPMGENFKEGWTKGARVEAEGLKGCLLLGGGLGLRWGLSLGLYLERLWLGLRRRRVQLLLDLLRGIERKNVG